MVPYKASKPWKVLLKAKGIKEVKETYFLGATCETVYELATGSYVRNIYTVISVDVIRRTAIAVFKHSRNMRVVRSHGKSR